MSGFDALASRNRRSVPWAAVPRETEDGFRETVLAAVGDGWRLISFFGMPEGLDGLPAGGDAGATMPAARSAPPAPSSATASSRSRRCVPRRTCSSGRSRSSAAWCPMGIPGSSRSGAIRPTISLPGGSRSRSTGTRIRFFRVEGEEVHEVAVGPVHAGIIEPGHFRFQAMARRCCSSRSCSATSTAASSGCWRRPSADRRRAGGRIDRRRHGRSGTPPRTAARSRRWRGAGRRPRAQAIRGIALELERLANHIGDLGAIAGDVAFQPGASYFGRMRGECLNLLMTISGNRYGRGLLRPGGVLFDIPPAMVSEARGRLERLPGGARAGRPMLLESPSVLGRLEGVGGGHPGDVPRARLRGHRGPGLRRAARRAARSSVRHLPVRPHPGRDGLGRRRLGAGAGPVAGDSAVARVSFSSS